MVVECNHWIHMSMDDFTGLRRKEPEIILAYILRVPQAVYLTPRVLDGISVV